MPTPGQFVSAQRGVWRGGHRLHRFTHVSRSLDAAISRGLDALNLSAGQTLLDFGCADQPYRSLLPAGVDYVGADLPGNVQAQVTLDQAGCLPTDLAPVDAVLSSQVLEHVTDPSVYLREALRALKPGGQLLLSTHGLMMYHPDPIDWWRWTGAGLAHVVSEAGFKLDHVDSCVGLGATGLQFVQDALLIRCHRRLHKPLMWFFQGLMAWMDRAETGRGESANAMVFIVRAHRPIDVDQV